MIRDRDEYKVRQLTDEERRWWPTADCYIEPRVRSAMPDPAMFERRTPAIILQPVETVAPPDASKFVGGARDNAPDPGAAVLPAADITDADDSTDTDR